ncbi:WD40/YVTN repeat-like containing protein [Gracilaria domingensis]|nr:WD40/YVTN repeat-like containing protein [Gracilaria domingensis]
MMVSGSDDGSVRLWGGGGGAAILSANRKLVVSSDGDKTVRLWERENGSLVCDALDGDESLANCVSDVHKQGLSVSANGKPKLVVLGGPDGAVGLWAAETGRPVYAALVGHEEEVHCVSLNANGLCDNGTERAERLACKWEAGILPLVAAGEFNGCAVRVWIGESGERGSAAYTVILAGHESKISCISVSYRADLVASGDKEGGLRLWDGESGRFVRELEQVGSCVASLEMTCDEMQLWSHHGTGSRIGVSTAATI